jgi:hypothetical protein
MKEISESPSGWRAQLKQTRRFEFDPRTRKGGFSRERCYSSVPLSPLQAEILPLHFHSIKTSGTHDSGTHGAHSKG